MSKSFLLSAKRTISVSNSTWGMTCGKRATSKMQPQMDMKICHDPKKCLHDVKSFVGAPNFYPWQNHNVTCG